MSFVKFFTLSDEKNYCVLYSWLCRPKIIISIRLTQKLPSSDEHTHTCTRSERVKRRDWPRVKLIPSRLLGELLYISGILNQCPGRVYYHRRRIRIDGRAPSVRSLGVKSSVESFDISRPMSWMSWHFTVQANTSKVSASVSSGGLGLTNYWFDRWSLGLITVINWSKESDTESGGRVPRRQLLLITGLFRKGSNRSDGVVATSAIKIVTC